MARESRHVLFQARAGLTADVTSREDPSAVHG